MIKVCYFKSSFHPGMVESYWEYLLKPWDTCAGVIILTEAGGKVTTLDGQAYRWLLLCYFLL
jgi:fructose-1,6-bisphosphatase/inositol monophosphatase family enzyme